jgi:hypothetical protein
MFWYDKIDKKTLMKMQMNLVITCDKIINYLTYLRYLPSRLLGGGKPKYSLKTEVLSKWFNCQWCGVKDLHVMFLHVHFTFLHI